MNVDSEFTEDDIKNNNLKWEKRKELILKEIIELNADVISLQELELEPDKSFIQELGKQGYDVTN